MKKLLILLAIFSFALSPLIGVKSAHALTSPIRTIIFPVVGKVTYYDDFGAPRAGHTHAGNDLMGKKLMPLVAAVDGTITNVNYPEATWGYSVSIKDSDGYEYWYLHMNNDTPGTDDDKGDGYFAYAPDIQRGTKVVKGQLVGWMGDSGDAETTQAHLHFEIHDPSGTAYSPFQSLQNATKITAPVAVYPKQGNEILPYETFGGAVTVAAANLDKDSDIEYVTGAGPGGGPLVKAFDKDGKQLTSFYAYDANFSGGIDVTAADVDNDGIAEIITAAGPGGGPHIKIFKLNGTLVKEFFAYDTNFRGGVNISAADMDKDGKAEIVTGPGAGGGPHVKVFKADGTLKSELMAYDPNFHGGVDVAAIGATTKSTTTSHSTSSSTTSSSTVSAGFVTVPGKGGGPDVKVFDDKAQLKKEFLAFDSSFNLGLRVAVGNANSGSSGMEIGVMPASGGGPNAKLFSTSGSQVYSGFVGYETWWRSGYDIALYEAGGVVSSGGNRRASIRPTTFSTTSTSTRTGSFSRN
jgi:Peptidase family M23